jgi:A/G-specific adenine glycosylase
VSSDCQAQLRGLASKLPSPKPATRVSDRTLHLVILRDGDGRVLLEKRPPAGIWGGLWCLPDGDSIQAIQTRLGLTARRMSPLPRFEHRLSHIRMTICPALADAGKPTQVQCPASLDWFARRQLPELGLPKPVTDLLKRLHDGEFD